MIRNGFIYQPANVALVGDSVVLSDESTGTEAFDDAREPVAQAFKKKGTADADAFAVIVNHFKSKGSGTADPDGQGNANGPTHHPGQVPGDLRRLVQDAAGHLAGVPRRRLQRLLDGGPDPGPRGGGLHQPRLDEQPDEETYNFDGLVGSLDHVLANTAALADVNAVDVWDINGYESVYYEYARFNTNVTNLYAVNPFRSSDHSPEIVGINTADAAAPVDVQILATNDFHGRIANDPTSAAAGAAAMAGAVKALRAANPNTVFAAAGDLIGASTFESFIDNDKPTIDALNSAGLEVSAAGNHEFDQGYNDLVNRVMAPYNADTNPQGGANWKYIAANIKFKADGADALTPSWTKTMNGVQVGFVGAVTEHLPELVTPGGISQIEVTDIVTAVNEEATDAQGRRRGRRRHARPRGLRHDHLRGDGRRPVVRLRQHRHRCQRRHRRDRLGPHPPGVQLLLPGGWPGPTVSSRSARWSPPASTVRRSTGSCSRSTPPRASSRARPRT